MTMIDQPSRFGSGGNRLIDSVTTGCVTASGLICLVSAFFFLFYRYPDYLHSDAAGIVLHAEEIIRSKQWTPTAWHYVSDTLSIFDNSHLAVPFVAALGVTKLAFAWTASLCLLMFLGSTYALGRAAGLQRSLAATSSLLMISGASMIYSDVLLGMMMTFSFTATAILLLMMIASLRDKNHERPAWVGAGILLLLFATNPRKAFVFQALPMVAALMACAYLLGKQEVTRDVRVRREFVLRAIFYSSCVGALVHAFALPSVSMDKSYAQHPFSLDMHAIADNFRVFTKLSWKFLGFSEDGDVGPEVLRTTIAMHRIATTAVLFSFFALGTLAAFRQKNIGCKFIATYAIATAALITVALLSGNKIKEHYGIYYLILAMMPGTIVSFFYVSTLPRHWRNTLLLVIVVPTLLLSIRNHVLGNPAYPGPGINQQTSNVEKYKLINWLDQRDLRNGYSIFWEANAITVLSDARIRVVPATLWLDGLKPFKWGVSQHQIDRMLLQSPSFVAIPYPTKVSRMPEKCLGRATTHQVGPYRVYVFSHGLSGCLPK